VRTVKAGDTVIFGPGERHWHGAAPRQAMIPFVLQEMDSDGKDVFWAEHVTAAGYQPVED
jgi:quercetin dioxygenase-like cupin family protein